MKIFRYIKQVLNHFLIGTNLTNWLKLLIKAEFKIKWYSIPKALFITFMTVVNLPISLVDEIIYQTKIKHTTIANDPIFVIGHWRSGTTYFINLMSKDKEFAFFDIIETFYPYAFVTLHAFLRLFSFIIPKTRPMDKVVMDLESPQEEDFSIANLTSQSITLLTVFPENRDEFLRFGIFEDVTDKEKEVWKKTYLKMIKKMTYRYKGKQLLIKSPANTCKIEELLELFPNAKFIHMYRNPYDVCASTFKMYKTLFPLFSLQGDVPDQEALAFQLELYRDFWKKYMRDKSFIPNENLVEVKYEDFVLDPLNVMKEVYNELGLETFNEAYEDFAAYVSSQQSYEPRKHQPIIQLSNYLQEHCQFVFDSYEYSSR